MTMSNKRLLLALAGFVGVCAAQSASAELVVGPGCPFTDLQVAMNAAQGSDAFIVVTAGYNGGPVSTDKTLHITGGAASCTDFTVIGQSTLQPGEGVTGPLITLSGQARFDLRNFDIVGAINVGGNGGGISFVSHGDHGHIELHNVLIRDNVADKGAGIFFDGGTDADDLVLDHVVVTNNFANNGGGGIRIQNDTHLTMDSASSIINNTANPDDINDGRGGGLQILDFAMADVFGIVADNHARYGGGISIHDAATVTAVSAKIGRNAATNSGGGIFIEPSDAFITTFDGTNVDISGNTAANGAAIYADTITTISGTSESQVFLQEDDRCSSCTNKISSNTATQEGGATIVIQDGGLLRLNRVEARSNSSDYFVRTFDHVLFRGRSDLIANNIGRNGQYALAAFAFAGDTVGDIFFSTIADNAIADTGSVFTGSTTNLTLQGDIIWQPSIPTLGSLPTSATSFIDDLMQDASTFDPTQFNAFGNIQTLTDPQFVHETTGDYRLQQTSPAVDFAATGPDDFTVDLLGNARGKRLVGDKPFDAGAYELQELETLPPPTDDHIFIDGFDGDN